MDSFDKSKLKTLVIEGETYSTFHTKKFENRIQWQKPNERIIISVIPGTVLKVSVAIGQSVKIGDEIIVLEAMKMKNHITVPIAGVIKSINVAEGQQIPKGTVILELE